MDSYDIYIHPLPQEEVVGTKCFGFGYKSALKVQGLYSLIGRWVRVFLTPKGSDLLYPEGGTIMSSLIGSNISSLTTDVQDAVVLAIDETNAQIREQDTEGFYSEHERLQNAYLMEYQPVTAGFNVWISITNAVGETLEAPLVQLEMR